MIMPMSIRWLSGKLMSYSYNHLIGNLPSRKIRITYLKAYLAEIGKGTAVQMGCRFLNGRKVHLGTRNVINFGCLFDGRHYHIRTGADVSIGPEATLLTLGHDPQSPEFGDKGGDIIIGDRVWIAYRAIILPGVTIGEGAVVGAGSVITQDIESYSIVAGVPAKIIGRRNPQLNYKLSYAPFLL
jgi:maltose O-acetyltransferase